MNNDYIIHIGYPKTGSTWFQNNFFNKIENFHFINKKQIKTDFMLINSLDFDANILKNKYLSYNKPLLLSHELLVGGLMHTGSINGILTKEFATRLKAVFSDAHIILFIRNQFDLIASSYNQYLRGGGNYSINRYLFQDSLDGINQFFFFSFSFLEFDKIITFYKDLFGQNNIHIFIFEDFKNNPKDFLNYFSNIFNFKINLNNIDYSPLNISFRRYIKPIYRIVNLLYRKAVLNKKNLFRLDDFHQTVKYRLDLWNNNFFWGPIDNSRKVLGENNYEFIKDYYKESNNRLIKEHKLLDIIKYNYPL